MVNTLKTKIQINNENEQTETLTNASVQVDPRACSDATDPRGRAGTNAGNDRRRGPRVAAGKSISD